MTDRVKGCHVAFGKDIRVDDVEFIINAIKMIKGVDSVTLNITDADDYMNRAVMKQELRSQFLDFYDRNLK